MNWKDKILKEYKELNEITLKKFRDNKINDYIH